MSVLIFGVFDMLHPGHVYFINEAKKQGNNLHICLATDEYVKEFKNKNPINNFEKRKETILKMFPDIFIHTGDKTNGDWSIFKNLKPKIIALGYDQVDLHNAILSSNLDLKDTKIIFIEPYLSDIYNTTRLQKLN